MLGGLEGNSEELPSLLLLKGAHLILEHLALQGALALVLHALKSALMFAEKQQVSLRAHESSHKERDAQQTRPRYYRRVSQPGEKRRGRETLGKRKDME